MKPICVNCHCFYRPKVNGVIFVEGLPTESPAPIGNLKPDAWKPYKVWSGDLWQCPQCGHNLISSVGRAPIAIQHEDAFVKAVKAAELHGIDDKLFQVNDC